LFVIAASQLITVDASLHSFHKSLKLIVGGWGWGKWGITLWHL